MKVEQMIVIQGILHMIVKALLDLAGRKENNKACLTNRDCIM